MRRLAVLAAVLLVAVLGGLAALEAHYRGLESGLRLRIAPPDEPGRKFVLNGPSLNAEGFRERDLELDKPERLYRIVVLGDSVTFGSGVRIHEAWPRYAEQVLAEERRVQLVNLAVFSYDAEQIVATLEHRGQRWSPDLVVYAAYTNDHIPTDLLYTETGPIYVGSDLDEQLSGPGFLLPHSALARRYFGAKATRQVSLRREQWGGDLGWYRQQLEALHAAAGELFIYALLPHNREHEEMHRRYLDLYEELGIPHASALPYLAGSGEDDFYIADRKGDDIAHPNPTGQRVLGWGFADALRRHQASEAVLGVDEAATIPAHVMESPDDVAPGVRRPRAGLERRDR
ncbi:MAG TPA: SGNH/GDSL hydrolase family protein [Myxococcota bacterium]|nr:SGNH/GDSL hydrolase family protein [Myxococcota bacterium]